MNNTNNQSARESFRIAKEIFIKAWAVNFGGDIEAARIYADTLKFSQGDIRCEVELNTTANQFQFAVTDNTNNSTGVKFNTENRLTMQDSMVVSEYGIFVAKPSSRTSAEFNLNTYGNTQDFAAAEAAVIDSTFYSNGGFSMVANNDVVIPFRALLNHWYKPQTQQTGALAPASPKSQIRGAEDGFITMEPNLLLIGSKGYKPIITLASNLSAAGTFSRAILIFRGCLAQNSTSVS